MLQVRPQEGAQEDHLREELPLAVRLVDDLPEVDQELLEDVVLLRDAVLDDRHNEVRLRLAGHLQLDDLLHRLDLHVDVALLQGLLELLGRRRRVLEVDQERARAFLVRHGLRVFFGVFWWFPVCRWKTKTAR